MAKGSDLDRVTSIVLRQMRAPILVLLGVNTLGVAVMVMIPGIDGTSLRTPLPGTAKRGSTRSSRSPQHRWHSSSSNARSST